MNLSLFSNPPETTVWDDVVSLARAASRPGRKNFHEALQAIMRSYEAGYISEEEFEAVLKEVVALAVELEVRGLLRDSFLGEPARRPSRFGLLSSTHA